ncbi:MAG: hypothetical protein AAGA68_18620 [Pseudomonadota bacterium]
MVRFSHRHKRPSRSAVRVAPKGNRLPLAVALALGLLLLLGAASSVLAQEPRTALMTWLTQDLEPTLSQRFTEHPRLRGQAVQVLAMRGTQARVRSDALTESIVRHLGKALADQAGTRVVPVGAAPSAQACMAQAAVEYRIGVDVRALGGEVQVDVRVFDVTEGTWVGGFGGSWSGALTARERNAQEREMVAESARGARELPFQVGQADLVAKDLAAQIDCIMAGARQREPRGAALYLAPAAQLDPHLQKAGLLLMHALRANHGWHQVTTIDEADLLLELHTQGLDQDLSVFWVTLSRASAQAARERREGLVASASTYVNGEDRQTRVAGRTVRLPRPEPVATPAQAAPPAVVSAPTATTLLSRPRMVMRRSPRACAQAAGARAGRELKETCAVVEVAVTRPATVFWLWQPASCRLQPSPGGVLPRVVSRRANGADTLTARLQSTDGTAYDSVYVIAVDARTDAERVREVLERHPGGSGCDAPQWERDLRRWALALESTLLRLGDGADWQAVRAPRLPTRMVSSEAQR